jgi:hypothetical protein
MNRFSLVFRGGCPKDISEGISDILNDTGLQDSVFITDVKTHSVDMISLGDINPLTNRLQGKYGLSIVAIGTQHGVGPTICLGKLQDGGVVKSMQDKAQGLFK